MCIQCHKTLSTQKVIDDFNEFKNKIDNCKCFYELSQIFRILNSVSISHMILTSLYVNGPDARTLAMYCFRKFIDWYKLRHNSKLYWVKKQLYGLFLSKEEQRLDNIFEYTPNISRLETIYANLLQFNRYTFMNGKYADLSDDEYNRNFFGHIEPITVNESEDEPKQTDDDESIESIESTELKDENTNIEHNKIEDENIELENINLEHDNIKTAQCDMQCLICQFIYNGISMDDDYFNFNCKNYYLFNRNHLFLFSVIIGLVGSILWHTDILSV